MDIPIKDHILDATTNRGCNSTSVLVGLYWDGGARLGRLSVRNFIGDSNKPVQYIAHLGLLNPEFEEKCDLMFGEGEFERRTALQYSNATYTSHKRRYASMSQDE